MRVMYERGKKEPHSRCSWCVISPLRNCLLFSRSPRNEEKRKVTREKPSASQMRARMIDLSASHDRTVNKPLIKEKKTKKMTKMEPSLPSRRLETFQARADASPASPRHRRRAPSRRLWACAGVARLLVISRGGLGQFRADRSD